MLSNCISVPALATNVIAVTGIQHEESIEKESASSDDGSPAVIVSMSDGDEVTVDIKGDVENSKDSDSLDSSKGVEVSSSGKKDDDNVSNADVNIGGDVTVISEKPACGIDASAENEAVTEVSAKNINVTSEGKDIGVKAGSSGNGSTVVEIEEDIKTTSYSDSAFGIVPSSDSGGVTAVTVGNDVEVKARETAEGVFAEAKSGTINVEVSGSVSAESEKIWQ